MRHLSLLILVASLVLPACHDSGEVTQSPSHPPGAMTYTGYDRFGHKVVTGWIRLGIPVPVAPAGPAYGDWSLRALVDPRRADLGPQVGAGTLAVELGAETVVNLNPGQTDANVVLVGTLRVGGPAPMTYEGTWTYSTFAGQRNSGTFKANE